MKEIKKGDIVGRISYGKDIIFRVKEIIRSKNEDIAILYGIFERIKADSNITDLEILSSKEIKKKINEKEYKFSKMIEEINYYDINEKSVKELKDKESRKSEKIIKGKILHLDGDRRYSEKSKRYYKKLELQAIVKNIPEYQQPKVVYKLLSIYNPDILVITGHDGMIKKGIKYNDIYNYKNSKYFIETVKEARRFDKDKNKGLVIFAGACQSYFEALIAAGANFASSPGRILIDFIDPILVAQKVALTEENKYITMDDIAYELKGGKSSINGIGANGKLKRL